jgi:hypothetical protein
MNTKTTEPNDSDKGTLEILDGGRTLSLRFCQRAEEIVASTPEEAVKALAFMLFREAYAHEEDLEVLREHRHALDQIFALVGHKPYNATCYNDPDFGETVRQAVKAYIKDEAKGDEGP